LVLLSGPAGDVIVEGLWPMNGLVSGSRFLAGSVTTAGALVDWIAGIVGVEVPQLALDAALVPPGSRDVLVMPYLSGERTPFSDPTACGAIFGLRGDHTRGDIFRACLEGIAFAARQNLDLFPTSSTSSVAFAVGGGVQIRPWVQIISDVSGVPQALRKLSIGACLGNAMFAAQAAGVTVDVERWNPVDTLITPDSSAQEFYASRYPLLHELYVSTNELTHRL
jgi:xylulokinase